VSSNDQEVSQILNQQYGQSIADRQKLVAAVKSQVTETVCGDELRMKIVKQLPVFKAVE